MEHLRAQQKVGVGLFRSIDDLVSCHGQGIRDACPCAPPSGLNAIDEHQAIVDAIRFKDPSRAVLSFKLNCFRYHGMCQNATYKVNVLCIKAEAHMCGLLGKPNLPS